MGKTLRYGWEVLVLTYKSNGFFAILYIFSKIYQDTVYPFLQLLLLSLVLDNIQRSGTLTLTSLTPYITAFILSTVLNTLLSSYTNLQEYIFGVRFETYLDRMVLKKLTSLDPQTFENPEFQSLFAQTHGIRGTMSTQLERVIGLLDAVTQVVTSYFVLLPLFPQFIPLIILSVIPSYYLGDVSRKKLWPFFSARRSIVLRMTEYVRNLLSQDNTSKEAAIFRTGPVLIRKVAAEQKTYIRDYRKINDPFVRSILFVVLGKLGVFLYTQYLNLSAAIAGRISIGQFALIFQQTQRLATGSQQILDMYSSMMMRTQLIEKFYEFLNYQPSITSPGHPENFPASPMPPVIEFRSVSFRYPKTGRDILKNFSMTVRSGEKIALVGENGAGKTTLIKLLLRFYDVTEGDLLINGLNIQKLNIEEWHRQVGALFQDFIKYQFTFRENVYYGNLSEKQNEKLLRDAIRKSGADTFVPSLPENLDQIVGKMFEGGVDLSGGQWQKLALARAFFRNAPILILDEPTSAIDAKAEYEIFQNVQKLQKDKTVIIISHRFSTVRNADRIFVLDNGKIIEEGNHEALMKKKGLYEELFTIQAKGYK